jgi:hypothetical protein
MRTLVAAASLRIARKRVSTRKGDQRNQRPASLVLPTVAPAGHRRRYHATVAWGAQPRGPSESARRPRRPSWERDQGVRSGTPRVVALKHLAKVARVPVASERVVGVDHHREASLPIGSVRGSLGAVLGHAVGGQEHAIFQPHVCQHLRGLLDVPLRNPPRVHEAHGLRPRAWRGLGPGRGVRSRARASAWPGGDLRASTPRRRSSKLRSAGTASTAGGAAPRWISRGSCLESSHQGSSAVELARLPRAAVRTKGPLSMGGAMSMTYCARSATPSAASCSAPSRPAG